MASTAEFWCKICKLPFATDGAFRKHKVNSARHICCDVCGADFNTEEGKKRHRAAHHAAEQDLTCKFCGRNYPRVGSLINHYEESQCKNISKETFKEAIKNTMGHQQAMRNAHNYKDIRRSGEMIAGAEEPLPPLRQASDFPQISDGDMAGAGWTGVQADGGQYSGAQQGGWSPGGQEEDLYDGGWPSAAPTDYGIETPLVNVLPDNSIGEDEDLIDLDPASEILNSSWSIPAAEVLKNTLRAKNFPALGKNVVNRGKGQKTAPGAGRVAGWVAGQNAGQKASLGVVSQGSTNRGPPHTWAETIATSSPNAAKSNTTVPPHLRGKMGAATTPSGNFQTGGPKQQEQKANTAWSNPSVVVADPAARTINNAPSFLNTSIETCLPSQALSTQLTQASSFTSQPPSNPWGSKNLFPGAPPAIAPPVDLLSSLAITPAPVTVYRRFDPSDPNFKASRYYVEVLRKWKCPHPGCNNSTKTAQGLINHLNSPAHLDEKFQCMRCYRYYISATALAQHAESQGVRCNVRETDDFELVVRGITANTATTNGRLADDTIRYEINPNAVLGRVQMAENLRAAQKLEDDKRANYWKNNKPNW
ncbi:uncharacterized protein RSE6_14199 [Rhynchosporium secalis]|uniref:C2H2-type domain-containing protein n=1 Tax=Rhynchosporium secalis TaxID=38038 RepID=A0A1E1MUT4_RHYSE|nr:uncharacterized protein RSE6_14199 [Rhynchosporium secalis]